MEPGLASTRFTHRIARVYLPVRRPSPPLSMPCARDQRCVCPQTAAPVSNRARSSQPTLDGREPEAPPDWRKSNGATIHQRPSTRVHRKDAPERGPAPQCSFEFALLQADRNVEGYGLYLPALQGMRQPGRATADARALVAARSQKLGRTDDAADALAGCMKSFGDWINASHVTATRRQRRLLRKAPPVHARLVAYEASPAGDLGTAALPRQPPSPFVIRSRRRPGQRHRPRSVR